MHEGAGGHLNPEVSALTTGLGTTEATLPATDALFLGSGWSESNSDGA